VSGRVGKTGFVPYHVMIWPNSSRQQALRELYAFNLEEDTLRERFIEPYERGESITWDGRTLQGGDLSYIRVGRTDAPFGDDILGARSFYYEAFQMGTEVTNDWIVRGAGTLAPGLAHAGDALAVSRVINICRRFGEVARQLQRRRLARATLTIGDEYDVQDLIHALLLVDFEDVRAESWNPSYLGGSSRIDFLLPDEKFVVEVKKTRGRLTDREIGNQLAEDVTRYSDPGANRGANMLVCFIYDRDRLLANPRGMERDLESASNERLKVIGVVGN
jgi:hypothetical protein